jgi:hypothetical protein
VEDSFEHGSIKCWEILEWLHSWRFLKKGSKILTSHIFKLLLKIHLIQRNPDDGRHYSSNTIYQFLFLIILFHCRVIRDCMQGATLRVQKKSCIPWWHFDISSQRFLKTARNFPVASPACDVLLPVWLSPDRKLRCLSSRLMRYKSDS